MHNKPELHVRPTSVPIELSNAYTTYCGWVECMSDETRHRLIKPKPPKLVATAMKKIRPYMEDEEVR